MDSTRTRPRLFISVPDDRHLDDRRQKLKRSIVAFIEKQGFETVGFESAQWGVATAPLLKEWSVERACDLLRRCDGAVVLGLARAHVPQPQPTPYNHLEGGLAISQGLRVLVFHEEGMDRSGILGSGITPVVIPPGASESFVSTPRVKKHFAEWARLVRERRDVFLGYCSAASSVARSIRKFLEHRQFSVVDWSRDFKSAGATILEEIERASDRCRCAIFLFTKDDELRNQSTAKASFDAVPRDNVLLEAGFFTRSHGKSRVAIVREKGAKMPVDFGGIKYVSFADRKKLDAAKQELLSFLNDSLGRGPG
jgi:hypothetical protein